jgi:hypothetical protein
VAASSNSRCVERYDVRQSWTCNSIEVRLEGKMSDGIEQSKFVVRRTLDARLRLRTELSSPISSESE